MTSALNTGFLVGLFVCLAFLGSTNRDDHKKTRQVIAATCTNEIQQELIDAAFIEGKIQGVRDIEKVMAEIMETPE